MHPSLWRSSSVAREPCYIRPPPKRRGGSTRRRRTTDKQELRKHDLRSSNPKPITHCCVQKWSNKGFRLAEQSRSRISASVRSHAADIQPTQHHNGPKPRDAYENSKSHSSQTCQLTNYDYNAEAKHHYALPQQEDSKRNTKAKIETFKTWTILTSKVMKQGQLRFYRDDRIYACGHVSSHPDNLLTCNNAWSTKTETHHDLQESISRPQWCVWQLFTTTAISVSQDNQSKSNLHQALKTTA